MNTCSGIREHQSIRRYVKFTTDSVEFSESFFRIPKAYDFTKGDIHNGEYLGTDYKLIIPEEFM